MPKKSTKAPVKGIQVKPKINRNREGEWLMLSVEGSSSTVTCQGRVAGMDLDNQDDTFKEKLVEFVKDYVKNQKQHNGEYACTPTKSFEKKTESHAPGYKTRSKQASLRRREMKSKLRTPSHDGEMDKTSFNVKAGSHTTSLKHSSDHDQSNQVKSIEKLAGPSPNSQVGDELNRHGASYQTRNRTLRRDTSANSTIVADNKLKARVPVNVKDSKKSGSSLNDVESNTKTLPDGGISVARASNEEPSADNSKLEEEISIEGHEQGQVMNHGTVTDISKQKGGKRPQGDLQSSHSDKSKGVRAGDNVQLSSVPGAIRRRKSKEIFSDQASETELEGIYENEGETRTEKCTIDISNKPAEPQGVRKSSRKTKTPRLNDIYYIPERKKSKRSEKVPMYSVSKERKGIMGKHNHSTMVEDENVAEKPTVYCVDHSYSMGNNSTDVLKLIDGISDVHKADLEKGNDNINSGGAEKSDIQFLNKGICSNKDTEDIEAKAANTQISMHKGDNSNSEREHLLNDGENNKINACGDVNRLQKEAENDNKQITETLETQEEKQTLANEAKYGEKKTDSKPSKYRCDVCHLYLSQPHCLKCHMLLHMGKKDVQCSTCLKTFLRKEDLVKHVKVHSDERPFHCPEEGCEKTFKSFRTMKLHLISQHRRKSSEIVPPPRKKIDVEEKLFVCDICGNRLSSSSALNRHQRRHNSVLAQAFKCEVCGKGFPSKCELGHHLVTHSNEKRFKCQECGKELKTKQGLRTHHIIFHGDKGRSKVASSEFKCLHCGGEYTNYFSLARHISRHRKQLSVQDQIRHSMVLKGGGSESTMGEQPETVLQQTASAASAVREQGHDTGAGTVMLVNEKGDNPERRGTDDENVTWETPDSTESAGDNKTECEPGISVEAVNKKNGRILHEGEECITENTQDKGKTTAYDKTAPTPINTSLVEGKNSCNDLTWKTDFIMQFEQVKKTIKCDACEETFSSKHMLRNHKLSHTSDKKVYKCEYCNKLFTKPLSLYKHKQLHNKSGTYTCKFCQKEFKTMEQLRQHGKLHLLGKAFPCEGCDKSFAEKKALTSHQLVHSQEKKFVCEKCGKAFRLKQQLKFHMMVHDNDRPYGCPVCQKRFTMKECLKNHMLLHSDKKKYVCHLCGRGFKQQACLITHQRSHTNKPTHVCKECGKGCKSASALKSHIVSYHLKPEDVDTCPFKVYKCDMCTKMFGDRQDRDRHMSVHTGEKPYSCDICGKAFSDASNMRAHRRNHSNDKPHKCHLCTKSFLFNRDLKKHLFSHKKQESTSNLFSPKKNELPPKAQKEEIIYVNMAPDAETPLEIPDYVPEPVNVVTISTDQYHTLDSETRVAVETMVDIVNLGHIPTATIEQMNASQSDESFHVSKDQLIAASAMALMGENSGMLNVYQGQW